MKQLLEGNVPLRHTARWKSTVYYDVFDGDLPSKNSKWLGPS